MVRDVLRYPIGCTLEANRTYVIGEPVNLRFTLRNQTDRALNILTWYTPLEGLAGEIFRVVRDGGEVPYQGVLAKRGDPSRDDYVLVEPGEVVSAVVNLSTVYDLSEVGQYRVEFTSRLHDVIENEFSIPRRRDVHQLQELPCEEVNFEIIKPSG